MSAGPSKFAHTRLCLPRAPGSRPPSSSQTHHPQSPPRSFRLFLHTKLSNPHYPPEIQAETTLINFTVTEKVGEGRTA